MSWSSEQVQSSAANGITEVRLPDVPVRNVRTLEELVGGRVAQRRLNMLLFGLFGVLGLGAAVLAFLTAWRREHPKVEKPARAPKNVHVTPPPPEPENTKTWILLWVIVGVVSIGLGVWFALKH